MEGLYVRNLVSFAGISFGGGRWNSTSTLSNVYPSSSITVQMRRVGFQIRHSHRLMRCSKTSDFQDFQQYAKPAQLLVSSEPRISTLSTLMEISNSLGVDESRSAYLVKLSTSSIVDSGLSDVNAGILLCLIDKNGESILQRISTTSMEEAAVPDLLCFQRSSADEFIFEGPRLENIEAVWIGLESGRWRLGGVSVTVVNMCQPLPTHTEEEGKLTHSNGLRYEFEAKDIHLGDGVGMSMVELRPRRITELSGDLSALLKTIDSQATSSLDHEVSNEESMREYSNLKFSLLLYDAMIILAGTSIMAVTIGEKATNAFLTGGTGGFLYLLLLQRSVDGLPAPTSVSMNKDDGNFNDLLRQLKGPISILGLALGFSIVAVKYGSGTASLALTPQDIFIGMTGFLSCKIAVVLAALKPMSVRLK